MLEGSDWLINYAEESYCWLCVCSVGSDEIPCN